MVRKLILLLSSLLLVQQAVASTVSTVSSTGCSGTLSISLLDSAVFSCSGDFALSGGTITSDLSILITSIGTLTLGDIAVSAPRVELGSQDGIVSIGSGSSISGVSISVWAASGVALLQGATITVWSGADSRVISPGDLALPIGSGTLTYDPSLPTPVPIPGGLLPMLFGLIAMFGAARGGLTQGGRAGA